MAGEPSRAMTWPSGRRSASSSVTRPLPQPASRTRLIAGRAAGAPGRSCPSGSSGRRPGRRCGRPSRAAGRDASLGHVASARSGRRAGTRSRSRAARYQTTAAPTSSRPAADEHRLVEGVDRGLRWPPRSGRPSRPAAGGLSGGNADRTAAEAVSMLDGQGVERRRRTWRHDDEDDRAQERLTRPARSSC